MNEFFASVALGDISAAAIVFGVIVAIIQGRLIPRRTHEDVLKDRDDWKQIALELLQINHKAVQAAEITATVVAAVPNPLPHPADPAQVGAPV